MSRSNHAVKIMVVACFVLLLAGFVTFRSGAFDHFFLPDNVQIGYEGAASAGVAYARKRAQDAGVDSLRDDLRNKSKKRVAENTAAKKEPEFRLVTEEMMSSSRYSAVFPIYPTEFMASSKSILTFAYIPWQPYNSPFRLPMIDSISKRKPDEEK